MVVHADRRRLVLTFEELLRRTNFAPLMREMLQLLQKSYRGPVDMEFTLEIQDGLQPMANPCFASISCSAARKAA